MSRLPNTYQEVEYIQSSGTQYIDTGVKPNTNTTIKTKIYITKNSQSPFSCRWSGAPEYDTFGAIIGSTGLLGLYYGRFSDGKYTGNISYNKSIVHDIEINMDNIIFDENKISITRGSFTSTENMYLGAFNNMGEALNLITGRIYPMKIKESDIIVRNLIPAKRNSDGKPGMYDITNSGKNLLDTSTLQHGIISQSDGKTITPNGTISYTPYIAVEPSEKYMASSSVSGLTIRCFYYDENMNHLSNALIGYPLTIPSDTYYIRLQLNDSFINELMLEKGSIKTPYEPYPFYTNSGTGEFTVGPDVLYGQLGGVDVAKNPGIEVVNGIIEQYKASTSTIDANTFVEFVDNMWTNTDTSLTSIANSSGYAGAVLIDDNKVFIAHQSDGTNKYLNGVICTISGTTITPGTDTTLVSTSDSAYMANGSSAVLIDTDKVFIAHASDGTNKYLNGIVCTISGTTITPGTDTTLVNVSNSATILSPVLIDTNKVFIAHSNNSSNYYLNGVICTISGTTITPGTDTTLVSTQYAGNVASIALIDTNKVFIAHQSNSNYYLNGIVCTISGTTITTGTDTTLRSIMYSSNGAKVCFIDTNKVFITHNSGKIYPDSSPTYYLYGIVCTISGSTITPGTDTTIYTYAYSAYGASIALIDTDKVFIAHQSDGTNRYLKGIICTISGTTITHGTDTTLISTTQSAVDASAVLVYDNKVLIAHKSDSTNGYLNGVIANLKKITAATAQIDGVTVSKCTTTTAGKVYVL